MTANFPRNVQDYMDRLFALADDPSKLFASEGELKAALFASMKSKAAGWKQPIQCMFRGCQSPSISKSHTVQRTGPITGLIEKGHVLTPHFSDGELQLKRVGASEASTFPGFCSKHELIFGEFERKSLIDTAVAVELQVFRTICREIRRKRYDVEWLERTYSEMMLRFETKAREEARTHDVIFEGAQIEDGVFGVAQTHILTGNRALSSLESLYDQHFPTIERTGESKLYIASIQGDILIPVALSGLIDYEVESRSVTLVCGVIPQSQGSLIYLAGSDKDKDVINRYIRGLKTDLSLIDLVEAWMVFHTDHWFLRPSVWDPIPADRKSKILEDMFDLSPHGPNYHRSIFDELRIKALQIPHPVVLSPEQTQILNYQRAKMA
ncbi:hypothetical protein [Neorhizobium sp. AL 9.2.2]|uniref:hypothetical protein n=1 Tax=Neorhizobium sp. AL 9.2.2 TaxID=2712894 RepID=UPI0015733266|nr:hypothetical protein [Neorhizobium sp. AL 9.2.2]NSY17723.1 hypothetical protein [Neorhizobium sp. AL 9.2.2]